MKKLIGVTIMAVSLLMSGACSNQGSSDVEKNKKVSKEYQQDNQKKPFKITNVKVKVVNDKGLVGSTIIEENGKEKEIVPLALYYDMRIKHYSDKSLINFDKDDLDFKILPDKELIKASKDAVGVNIFDDKKGLDGLGRGSGYGDFDRNRNGKINVSYDLGFTTKSGGLPVAPNKEKIKMLKENALTGVLVVIKNKEEIGRYNLNAINKID